MARLARLFVLLISLVAAMAAGAGATAPCALRSSFGFLHVAPPSHALLVDADPTTWLPFVRVTLRVGNETTDAVKALIDLSSGVTITPSAGCFTQPEAAERCTGTQGAPAVLTTASSSGPASEVAFADGSILSGHRIADSAATLSSDGATPRPTEVLAVERVNAAARHSGAQAMTVLGVGRGALFPAFRISFTTSPSSPGECDFAFRAASAEAIRVATVPAKTHGGYRVVASFVFASALPPPVVLTAPLSLDSTYDGIVMRPADLNAYVGALGAIYGLPVCGGSGGGAAAAGCPLLRSEYGEGRLRASNADMEAPLKHALAVHLRVLGSGEGSAATATAVVMIPVHLMFERLACSKDAVTIGSSGASGDCVALKAIACADAACEQRCGLPCLQSFVESYFDPASGDVAIARLNVAIQAPAAAPQTPLMVQRPQAAATKPAVPPPRSTALGSGDGTLHRAEDKAALIVAEGEAWTAAHGFGIAALATIAFGVVYVWLQVRARRAELTVLSRTERRRGW